MTALNKCYSPGLCSLCNIAMQDSCQEYISQQAKKLGKSANQSQHLKKSTGTFKTQLYVLPVAAESTHKA